jgi:hypothetical protein
VVVKNLKLAYGAGVGMSEPLLNAALHEEVLKVAGQDDHVFFHLDLLVAEAAFGLARLLLIKFIELMKTKSLELKHVLAIL